MDTTPHPERNNNRLRKRLYGLLLVCALFILILPFYLLEAKGYHAEVSVTGVLAFILAVLGGLLVGGALVWVGGQLSITAAQLGTTTQPLVITGVAAAATATSVVLTSTLVPSGPKSTDSSVAVVSSPDTGTSRLPSLPVLPDSANSRDTLRSSALATDNLGEWERSLPKPAPAPSSSRELETNPLATPLGTTNSDTFARHQSSTPSVAETQASSKPEASAKSGRKKGYKGVMVSLVDQGLPVAIQLAQPGELKVVPVERLSLNTLPQNVLPSSDYLILTDERSLPLPKEQAQAALSRFPRTNVQQTRAGEWIVTRMVVSVPGENTYRTEYLVCRDSRTHLYPSFFRILSPDRFSAIKEAGETVEFYLYDR